MRFHAPSRMRFPRRLLTAALMGSMCLNLTGCLVAAVGGAAAGGYLLGQKSNEPQSADRDQPSTQPTSAPAESNP